VAPDFRTRFPRDCCLHARVWDNSNQVLQVPRDRVTEVHKAGRKKKTKKAREIQPPSPDTHGLTGVDKKKRYKAGQKRKGMKKGLYNRLAAARQI
jgi:hypothetical protein